MKHGFRPRLTPDPASTRRLYARLYAPRTEQVHAMVVCGRLMVSQTAYDQLKAGVTPASMSDAVARYTGMVVEVSPFLPFWREVAKPALPPRPSAAPPQSRPAQGLAGDGDDGRGT